MTNMIDIARPFDAHAFRRRFRSRIATRVAAGAILQESGRHRTSNAHGPIWRRSLHKT
ncbi:MULTISPECIES: hypothetical protein [unclassified Exiguobacterium]|uniref:hypothetical protein n=1 Tax=unclassified Exiguobacterium TaxID=2644629 RepID=UPI0013156A0B|nr:MULTISPECIES: hypothetical protein [unclassified Exiguobacterium]